MPLSSVVSEIFNIEKCRDLEIGVIDHSRSLKIAPFGKCYLLTLSLKCTVFEIFEL